MAGVKKILSNNIAREKVPNVSFDWDTFDMDEFFKETNEIAKIIIEREKGEDVNSNGC